MRKSHPDLALLLWLPAAFACKKDASHTSNSCKIVATYDTIFYSAGTYASSSWIAYDNDGRIAYGYGAVITRNAHLIRSAQLGQSITEYSYTFDNAGKITSATSRFGAQVNKSRYEYDCQTH